MKKKIIIVLSIFSLFFFLGGVYIILTIETTTSKLDNLIKLHQVEILREHLLIQVQQVQSDLLRENTRFARDTDKIKSHVRDMQKISDRCLGCHHTEKVTAMLSDLSDQMETYKKALSRVIAIRSDVNRLGTEKDNAFRLGEDLLAKLKGMIAVTSVELEKRRESAFRDIANTKIVLFAFVLTSPFIAVGLAFIFIRGFTKPVNVLLDATRRLKGGDLDFRIERLKDEFGEVAASFNEMAGSLKEQMIKMQRTEQMVVLGELAAVLAHEIKNPLTGIKAAIEVLSEELKLEGEEREIIIKVVAEIKRIEILIKSLLNFAKPPKPQLMTIDLNFILDKTITLSLGYPSFLSDKAKRINIIKDLDESIPSMGADPMQLQQVFLNLFLNAADAMPDGGTLTVKTSYDTDVNYIHIEISDTGKGINEKVIGKIFQPFFTTKTKGTGLGLAITKQLIEQHGGSICIESKPGRGATFRISLPVKQMEEGQAV